jgi:tRNA threonylcarbamoyladenosine biosynthesis protein TsaE
VEWPENAGDFLPKADLQIFLDILETGRNLEVRAGTETGKRCLETLKNRKTS